MIDLVLTHLTHPWGPPGTLETLGDPWRPLATMPENGQNGQNDLCLFWSRLAVNVLTNISLNRSIGLTKYNFKESNINHWADCQKKKIFIIVDLLPSFSKVTSCNNSQSSSLSSQSTKSNKDKTSHQTLSLAGTTCE